MLDSLPHWNSTSGLKFIMDAVGIEESEAFARENLGFEAGTEQTDRAKCFQPKLVRALFSQPRQNPTRPVRYIFTVFDPVAGSKRSDARTSDFVIISIGLPVNIILGVDALDVVRTEEYQEPLRLHLERNRARPFCREATIVIDAESGTGLCAGDIDKYVQDRFDNVIVIQPMDRKPGTVTSHRVKEDMAEYTHKILMSGEYCFAEQIATSHPNPAKLLAEFRDQLIAYEKVLQRSGIHEHLVYTGKGIHGKAKDDLAVTFQRAVRLCEMYRNNPMEMLSKYAARQA